jgi:hypothetical protein
MKTRTYNHHNALDVIPFEIKDIVIKEVNIVNIEIKKYSANTINKTITMQLKQIGWSDPIRIDDNSKISITSTFKEIGLCLQTGNVSRTYADMLKLQTLYLNKKILAGIIIVPTIKAASKMGGNVASFERISRELLIFKSVITVPVLIIGFYD